MSHPTSCDTFVCLPPHTKDGAIIFGKNSDRPSHEVQEIVYFPQKQYNSGDKLQCTYIEIDQVTSTLPVILSKPSWMWGAEMGSNSLGVSIGNEAVWTHIGSSSEDLHERLLGMDLLRLGLERGKTAREALDVITTLLEKYGQGGPCSDTFKDMTYHNSFLLADREEAWVLETAGALWAAEKVTSGFRNISNSLSIGTRMDLKSEELEAKAEELGLWDGGLGQLGGKKAKGEFNFSKVFGSGGACDRFSKGRDLLQKLCNRGEFDLRSMMKILRDEGSGINMGGYDDGGFGTTSSQVSVLSPTGSNHLTVHWFTGTPDPKNSIFKPFVFPLVAAVDGEGLTRLTTSPIMEVGKDPAKVKPRFKTKVDRRHSLYKIHQGSYDRKICRMSEIQEKMSALENTLIERAGIFRTDASSSDLVGSDGTFAFHEFVTSEMEIYSWRPPNWSSPLGQSQGNQN